MGLMVVAMDPADIVPSKTQVLLMGENARLPLPDEEGLGNDDDDMQLFVQLLLQFLGGIKGKDGFTGSGDYLHDSAALVSQPGFNARALPSVE